MTKDNFSDVSCNIDYCALTGVASFFMGIRNAVVIVNGPQFCYAMMEVYLNRCYRENLEMRLFGTDLKEQDMIFGSENKLKKILLQIKARPEVELVVVQNNCAASLIGDDLQGIVDEIGFNCPVITLDSGGLQGGFESGYRLAAERLLEVVALKPVQNLKRGINLIGCSEQVFNFVHEYEELFRMLAKSGISINCCMNYELSLEQLKNMRAAELNVVLYPELGLVLAKLLEDKFQIPYVAPDLPVGLEATEKWLKAIVEALEMEEAGALRWLEQEKTAVKLQQKKLQRINGEAFLDTIVLVGRPSMTIALAEALRKELVNYRTVELVLPAGLDSILLKEKYYHCCSGLELESLKKARQIFLFGSYVEHIKLLQQGIKADYCCIAQPGQGEPSLLPLMGMQGVRNLLQRIWCAYLREQEKRFLE